MTRRRQASATDAPAADAALDALAAALAPRVARLLREQGQAPDNDQAVADVLARAGYEIDEEIER